MTISSDEDVGPMETRSFSEQDSQNRQFCETRIKEIHSILNEDVVGNFSSNVSENLNRGSCQISIIGRGGKSIMQPP